MRFRWFFAGAIWGTLVTYAAEYEIYWLTGIMCVISVVIALAMLLVD